MTPSLTLSKTTSNPTNKDKDEKTPLAVLPTAKGVSNMDFLQSYKPLENYFATCKPLDIENNRSYMTVINLLSKDLLKVRKPA